jgi:hypothetical protein
MCSHSPFISGDAARRSVWSGNCEPAAGWRFGNAQEREFKALRAIISASTLQEQALEDLIRAEHPEANCQEQTARLNAFH